jgi:hypothetical protein
MKPARRQQGKSAFDLIEEGTQLLRAASAATLATYYLGAIPFVLGLLFFWADMSRNPEASRHVSDSSLLLCLLFLWLKFWQAIFARRLRAQITREPPPALALRHAARIFLTQTILQPLGLFLLPLSAVLVLPFPWVYQFYQNVTALAAVEEKTPAIFKKANQLARLWPLQNTLALAVLLAFALMVFLNWAVVCLTLPQLLKMLLGIQSTFAESPMSLLNSTFFTALFGLTYLAVDPIVKIFYVLRCFYGESLQSGADLQAELKPFILPSPKIPAALLLVSLLMVSSPVVAADPVPAPRPAPASRISPGDLDQAIHETIHERKFTWRMPPEKITETDANQGVIARFFDTIGDMLQRWAKAVFHWLNQLLKKLWPHHPVSSGSSSSNAFDFVALAQLLLWALVAAALIALLILLYRVWRGHQKTTTAVASEVFLPAPDVIDENVRADQLPEDGWTRLAREFLARGEFRLAMRAFYLASLSHLAARNLISIARFKSNLDYERELRRRAHSFPELLATFNANLGLFEQVWYGRHQVDQTLVLQFAQNVDRLKAAG